MPLMPGPCTTVGNAPPTLMDAYVKYDTISTASVANPNEPIWVLTDLKKYSLSVILRKFDKIPISLFPRRSFSPKICA